MAVLLPSSQALAKGAEAEELAKQLAKPAASLVSVPLQFNLDEGLGPNGDGRRTTTSFQPVIAFALTDELQLISRTIIGVSH